jgi:hypothetical protein
MKAFAVAGALFTLVILLGGCALPRQIFQDHWGTPAPSSVRLLRAYHDGLDSNRSTVMRFDTDEAFVNSLPPEHYISIPWSEIEYEVTRAEKYYAGWMAWWRPSLQKNKTCWIWSDFEAEKSHKGIRYIILNKDTGRIHYLGWVP